MLILRAALSKTMLFALLEIFIVTSLNTEVQKQQEAKQNNFKQKLSTYGFLRFIQFIFSIDIKFL